MRIAKATLRNLMIDAEIFRVIWPRYSSEGVASTLEQMRAAAEERLFERGELKRKPGRKNMFSRDCIGRCGNKISDRNKSGICTGCWTSTPDWAAEQWDTIRNQESQKVA